MQSLLLARTSEQHSKPQESQSKNSLIREWLLRFALNAGQALSPTDLGVYQALWSDGFEDLPYAVLEAAFKKTLRMCKFWPVKVADIREHVDRTREIAVSEGADVEWQRVLQLRRVYWNPDTPGGFSRGMPKLSERVQAACRASGVFREVRDAAELHVWGKKRFIESYLAWDALEQDQYLLPDGELKNLLAGCAETKALPSPQPSFQELHARGLKYSQDAVIRSLGPQVAIRYAIWDSEEQRQEASLLLGEKETNPNALENIRRQKAALAAKGFEVALP